MHIIIHIWHLQIGSITKFVVFLPKNIIGHVCIVNDIANRYLGLSIKIKLHELSYNSLHELQCKMRSNMVCVDKSTNIIAYLGPENKASCNSGHKKNQNSLEKLLRAVPNKRKCGQGKPKLSTFSFFINQI